MRLAALLLGVVVALAPGLASAQTWPARPVHIVVSFAPGGTADILARMVADKLTAVLGQSFVVENKAGAGGHLGASAVARAEADGYTFLLSGSPTHSVGPHLFKRLTYDPMKDVPPVAMIAAAPNLLVVNASLPVNSLEDLVKMMREKPGQMTYSSAGNGTSGHLAAELLKNMAKVEARHVPYRGGPEAVTGVVAGDINFIFFTVPAVLPQVEAGKLRALAITSASRSQLVPNVRTVAEAGYPGFEALAWYGLFAPRGTPAPIVERLDAEVAKIVQAPEFRDKMVKLGMEPKFLDAKQLTDFIAVESPRWGKLLREAGIEPQ